MPMSTMIRSTTQTRAVSFVIRVRTLQSTRRMTNVANNKHVTINGSVSKNRSKTVGESESETETEGWSNTDSTSETESENASSSEGHHYGYDSPLAIGLPDNYSYSTGSAFGSGSATTNGSSSTVSGSTSTSRGRFTSETVGEGETHSVGRSESVVESEGVARSNGRAVGETTTLGSSSGLAHSQGYSEALLPIMALRPGGVHSKENILYQAAQMLRSLPTGRCVINYVGPNGLETAMLKIPYRETVPLSDETFAKLRTAIFETSPSALPTEEAEAHLRNRRQRLLATTVIDAEPQTFRVPIASSKT
jgi:hypothetical protein